MSEMCLQGGIDEKAKLIGVQDTGAPFGGISCSRKIRSRNKGSGGNRPGTKGKIKQGKRRGRKKQKPKLDPEGRTVAVDTLDLCRGRLEASGYELKWGRGKYLFYFLSRVLHTNIEGAYIHRETVPDNKPAVKLLELLEELRLIRCIDWYSWLPTDWDRKNSKGRRFLPTIELMMTDILGRQRVLNYAGYLYKDRCTCEKNSSLIELGHNPNSGVQIPDIIDDVLKRGTGLIFDSDYIKYNMLRSIKELPENQKLETLIVLHRSMTVWNEELKPGYNQGIDGRIYTNTPNLQGLPEVARGALMSIDDFPLFNLDYRQFELRLLYHLSGQTPPRNNCFLHIGNMIGLSAAEVKSAIYPISNGQIINNISYSKQPAFVRAKKQDHHQAVTAILNEIGLGEIIRHIQEKDKLFVRRIGAKIFYTGMSKALEKFPLRAGLPLHDGWIFAPETDAIAGAVAEIFQKAPMGIIGTKMPVRCPLLIAN